jgi:nitrogen regulatory protein P-II 1
MACPYLPLSQGNKVCGSCEEGQDFSRGLLHLEKSGREDLMKLLVLILNRVDKLEEVLEGFVEIGITGATIIDSIGMGHVLSEEVPIFLGLRFMFAGAKPHNKTIISVIRDNKEKPAIKMLSKILGSLNQPGTGIVFTLPIESVKGMKPEA